MEGTSDPLKLRSAASTRGREELRHSRNTECSAIYNGTQRGPIKKAKHARTPAYPRIERARGVGGSVTVRNKLVRFRTQKGSRREREHPWDVVWLEEVAVGRRKKEWRPISKHIAEARLELDRQRELLRQALKYEIGDDAVANVFREINLTLHPRRRTVTPTSNKK